MKLFCYICTRRSHLITTQTNMKKKNCILKESEIHKQRNTQPSYNKKAPEAVAERDSGEVGLVCRSGGGRGVLNGKKR